MQTRAGFLLAVLAAAALGGCGGAPEQGHGGPTVATEATLGGVVFPTSSQIIDSRLGHMQPGQSPWTGAGWGSESGHTLRLTFGAGGAVRGVQTVVVTESVDGTMALKQWLARDKSGDIHCLKRQKAGAAGQLWGLAAGSPAALYAPRSADIDPGHTWYH